MEQSNMLSNNLSVRLFLNNSHSYWNSTSLSNSKTLFTPSYSNINSPSRASWRPLAGIESFSYSEGILADILSKREYLFRHLFSSKEFKSVLPDYFVASPKNPILSELVQLFPFADPINLSIESSRDLLYTHSSVFNLSLVQALSTKLNNLNTPLNTDFINNYALYYLFGPNPYNYVSNYTDFYKNQYRPMAKGISNMIKLHATGAIAMPTETRLHLLASSKDVIHSWAIPSAGIKIDCVPGYSSHRITIFLVSGIFWGQCMEICGRFHHWMPIIVFFIKRDLFFLWCTHFMHYSLNDNSFNIPNKDLTDYSRFVSHNKLTWSKESLNFL